VKCPFRISFKTPSNYQHAQKCPVFSVREKLGLCQNVCTRDSWCTRRVRASPLIFGGKE